MHQAHDSQHLNSLDTVQISMVTVTESQGSVTTLPKPWSDALTEFTANQIPIHLIDLRTLHLVSRSDVARYYRPILASHLQKHPSHQYASQQEVTRAIFKLVKYAIFSHRWLAEGEPTFQDMPTVSAFADVLIQDDEVCFLVPLLRLLYARIPLSAVNVHAIRDLNITYQAALVQTLATRIPDAPTRTGLHKLLLFCSKARSYRCPFAWSDTCCIHKDSSAELDESIRSMFRWYRNAFICVVHLASSLVLDDIPADEWFTRGWTLQELLAPENMKFYNREWCPFTEARSDKDRRNDWVPEEKKNPVWRAILGTTRIPSTRFSYFSPGASDVAQRLSWAAGRRTTRIEDMAYALVGIFGIYMPVQYGEGKFAFQRLMEELLQRVQSYGLFVWTGPSSSYTAALPASIEGYLAAREAEDFVSVPNSFGDPSLMMTHKGLQVEVLLVRMQCREEGDDNSEGGTSSSQQDEERSYQKTDLEVHNDQGDLGSIESGQDDFATEPQDARPPSALENDGLGIRFLDNDEDYQPNSSGQFSWFHFTDPDGIFRPLSVRGHGPIVSFDDLFTFPGMSSRQYAFAILDYHRDLERGPGHVYVPYPNKSRYLAFVLYRDDPGEVWHKMQTNALVYVETRSERMYEGQTVSVCL